MQDGRHPYTESTSACMGSRGGGQGRTVGTLRSNTRTITVRPGGKNTHAMLKIRFMQLHRVGFTTSSRLPSLP